MKRATKILATFAVVAAAAVGFGMHVKHALHTLAPPPRSVTTTIGDIAINVEETGTIQPVDKIDVKSKVAGRILSIPIQEGDRVQAGQLIATVDRTLLDPQIAQTQAQLDQAKAHLQQSVASYQLQVVQTKMAIAQAQAGVETAQTHLAAVAAGSRPQEVAQQQQAVQRAQITLDDALRTNKRDQTLLARGFIPQSQADAAQVVLDTARSTLAAAQQALSLTEAGPRTVDVNDARAQADAARVQLASARGNELLDAVRKSDIVQAQASVAQIASSLSQLEVQAHDTRIVAPASGIVLKKYKQDGEIVQSATTGFSDAQSIVATLGGSLEVLVNINEVDIVKVKRGASATMTVDAVPGATFAGVVTEIAPASTDAFPDASTGASSTSGISKFAVKVAFDRYYSQLRPGMSADVIINSVHHTHVVLVPLEAVPFSGNAGSVQVVDAAGRTHPQPVTLGLRNDINAEVIHGLKAGDRVAVTPLAGHRRTIDITGG